MKNNLPVPSTTGGKKVSQLFSQLTIKELQENKLMITINLDILFFKPLAVRTTEKTFINATLMVV